MAPNVPEEKEYPDPASGQRRRRSDVTLAASLPLFSKFCYSVGHMLNDLCSAIWFTYVLIFLQHIVKLSSTKAGIVIMVGQFADAISTPFIGIQLDDGRMFHARNVKRKSWHLLGTICVVVSFPLLFVECLSCDETSIGVYLGLLFIVVVFQFGWAATQVAHLSLIPQMTSLSRERDLLSNLRYSVQEFAQILCFFIAWLIFKFVGDDNKETEAIGEDDAPKFRNLAFIITGLGLVFAALFQLGVHENLKLNYEYRHEDDHKSLIVKTACTIEIDSTAAEGLLIAETTPLLADDSQRPLTKNCMKWLKDPRFYQVCAVYLWSRLFTNISSVYFPLYLEESLGAPQIMIIYIPLILNISGLATCLILEPINSVIGKKISFALFCCVSLCGCLIIITDGSPNFEGRGEYGMAVLMGSGSAAMVAIALSFVPDLLGTNVQNGALVYGLLSFVEKLINGIAVFAIQYSHGIVCEDFEGCYWFYRNLMLFILGAIILISLVCIMVPVKFAQHHVRIEDNLNWPIEFDGSLSSKDPKSDDVLGRYECDMAKTLQYGSI